MFELKVYTPEGAVVQETVSSVSLQTKEGEIEILANHARYIAQLGTGILRFMTQSGEKSVLVASEGFCQFEDNVLTVLADAVDLKDAAAGRNLKAERDALQKEIAQANFFEPSWDLKVAELKRLEALELIAPR